MARIIPKAGSVFSPRTPGVQLFRPGRAPAPKSKAQEASEILGIINQGIAAGQQIYGLGSAIAEDLAPTEAELLAERQGEMISQGMTDADARRVAARQKLGIGSVEGAQQARQDAIARMQARDPDGRAGYTEPPTMESVAPPGHPLRWPDTPQAQAPETMQITIPEGTRGAPAVRTSIAEELRRRGFEGTDAELREKARQLIYGPGGAGKQTRPGVEYEFEIPEGWSLSKAVAETPSTPLEQKTMPSKATVAKWVDFANRADPSGEMSNRIKAATLEVAGAFQGLKLTPEQDAMVRALAAQRAHEAQQAQQVITAPVTADEFFARSDMFTVSDLRDSYGALMAQGREQDARDLLAMANMASDAASFMQTRFDQPRLVESRIRDAIKSGHKPAAQAPYLGATLDDVKKILGTKRRRGSTTTRRRKKGMGGEDDKITNVLKALGLYREGMTEAQKLQRMKLVISQVNDGTISGEDKKKADKIWGGDLGNKAAQKRVDTFLDDLEKTRLEADDLVKEHQAKVDKLLDTLADAGVYEAQVMDKGAPSAKQIDRELGLLTGRAKEIKGLLGPEPERTLDEAEKPKLKEELKGITHAMNALRRLRRLATATE